ncbi:trypsin-like peptidase domain-containing protein [Sandarakinorhabdus sp.]|uniref:trypsin-like peptidase domain-containing protein n=1 Tax=Sandarakinorhabdus sp. TaxID=1916663 RepID=UPI00333F6B78
MLDLPQGQRIDIAGGQQHLRFVGQDARLFGEVGAFLLPFTAAGQISADWPAAFLGHGAPPPAGIGFDGPHAISLDLAQVPGHIDRVLAVLYVLGGPSRGFGLDHVGRIETIINGTQRCVIDMQGRRETALIAVEYYRRGAGWRLAATGQGFTTGIPGLRRAYCITLDVPFGETPAPGSDGSQGNNHRGNPLPSGAISTGSGFAVGARLIMTNYHVIEDAREIGVAGEARGPGGEVTTPAQVVAADPINDIALLALNHDALRIAPFWADHDVELGEDVIVAGFPLQGLLGTGPQISGGNISALTGVRGDAASLQFTSPIGSGSSGGPMLNSAGHVVGLVRGVLRGDGHDNIAQNINFGIKASLLRSFLHAAGTAPTLGRGPAMTRAEIARQARDFLYRITVTH